MELPDYRAANPFPIVGVGASAGGLAALEQLFAGLSEGAPLDMALVVVQHLGSDHVSALASLIGRYTPMDVFEVVDGVAVAPNCVYVIPPGHEMTFANGRLHLGSRATARGSRNVIDVFFSSLAQDLHERAIAIVLSGTGSDGTFGARAIKNEGGLVIAQTASSAEFEGMPQSIIAAGLADATLAPAEMGAYLRTYAESWLVSRARPSIVPEPGADEAIDEIFVLLRSGSGHDFSQYKPSTVRRRIERRMAVTRTATLDDYVKLLKRSSAEIDALFGDMLIGVTSFFRDPDLFALLETMIIPGLFAAKTAEDPVRVWSIGCSTGEEAYSIAILLAEHMEALKHTFTVQIFATDMDSRAIASARTGVFPLEVAADISAERLARFFTLEPDGTAYRVRKSIRDLVVFSEHDILRDPPFSKLDLVSCRNLLIYLGPELQKRLIPLFHYALKPAGTLFVGSSEGIGDFGGLFETLERSAKLYRRLPGSLDWRRTNSPRRVPMAVLGPHAGPVPDRPLTRRLPLRELSEKTLLRHLSPSAALVDETGDIFYVHGRTGLFLEPAPGASGVNNIVRMAREGLRLALTASLREAAQTQLPVRTPRLRVRTNGHFTIVDLTVVPAATGPETPVLYLVVFEPSTSPAPDEAVPPAESVPETDSRVRALLEELQSKEGHLERAAMELQYSTEELMSTNEEMQSVNEELQSTNEELETSTEELQSVNEELATVNTELQAKVFDLTRTNNDMNNLLAGTGIGTVFLNHELQVLRFTPAAVAVTNLMASDVGRPFEHIRSNLVGYESLVADMRNVLDTLIPVELEVLSVNGAWYTMRIQPYRTLENVIEGLVISYVDISKMKEAERALQLANELHRLAIVVRDARDAITLQDLDGRTLAWNAGAERLYGWSEAEALAMNVHDRIPPDERGNAMELLRKLSNDEVLAPYRARRLTSSGDIVAITITSTALVDANAHVYAISTTERPFESGT